MTEREEEQVLGAANTEQRNSAKRLRIHLQKKKKIKKSDHYLPQRTFLKTAIIHSSQAKTFVDVSCAEVRKKQYLHT